MTTQETTPQTLRLKIDSIHRLPRKDHFAAMVQVVHGAWPKRTGSIRPSHLFRCVETGSLWNYAGHGMFEPKNLDSKAVLELITLVPVAGELAGAADAGMNLDLIPAGM